MTTVTNGVNVQALLDAREVLKGAPEAAQFTWRAAATWQNGVHSQIKVQSFFGLGEEQSHQQESVFEADHPEIFAATDKGITPIEYLIVGLASCLTAGVASVAQNRGIQLNSVTSTVEGGHDIRGIWETPVDPMERARARVIADQEYLRAAVVHIRADLPGWAARRLTRGTFILWASDIPIRYTDINAVNPLIVRGKL